MPGAREVDTSSDSRRLKQKAGIGVDGPEKGAVDERNNGFSSHTQVVAFIWAVCRRIIPEEFLGSKRNWRNLRRNIFSFVSLRRHETFSLQQCMFKLRLSGYAWWWDHGCSCSKEAPDGGYRKGLLEKWIHWLFTELIVPLIQAHFYVTESERYRQNVLFYRKSVWAKMQANAVMEMKKSNFKRLSAESTVDLLKQGSLGVSRARLLPKKTGMRLIANLGGSSVITAGWKEKGKTVEMIKNQLSTIISKQNENRPRIGQPSKRREKARGPIAARQVVKSNPMKLSTLNFKPINLVLKDAYFCLKYEQEAHGQDLGCSVFDYNDVYKKLLPYVIDLKQQIGDAGRVFLVVCDVSQAFDSINQDKLIEILQEFVREEEYSIRRYGHMSKSLKVFHERAAMPSNKNISLVDFFLQKALKQQNAVCIDQAYATTVKQSHIMQLLKDHILRNILQLGKHNYLQVVGIPQGSILSSLLCSLYYGHLERCRLASLSGPGYNIPKREKKVSSEKMAILAIKGDAATLCESHCNDRPLQQAGKSWNILLRLVDDWLFISNSEEDALEFLKRTHRGFADYNCMANRRKTAVSFIADIGGSRLNMNVYRTKDGACFIRWSGLLINCNTLEVQADYTRYCKADLRSTLTVWRKENYGCHLMAKLCIFMRPKCHPILYDANINSPSTVFLNAYQAFLLCAMKFHAYNRSLPYDGECNPKFGFKAVRKAARYMHSLLVHRTRKISKSSLIKPLLQLCANETCWLAFRAFQMVLMRKQSRYAALLVLIKKELSSGKYDGFSGMPSMVCALDASRSSMFEDIVY